MKHPENQRIQVVKQFENLNLTYNKELNDLIILVQEMCKTPIVLITLIGEHHQIVKCKVGIDIESVQKEDTFCHHLKRDALMVVPDAQLDIRFKHLPAVTSAPGIRFYAGAPLITSNGYHIGSLCVADHKPGDFSSAQEEMLAIISRQVVFMMEIQLNNLALMQEKEKTAASERKLRSFFNSSKSCHILLDRDMKILDFNNAAADYIKNNQQKEIKHGISLIRFVSRDTKKQFDERFMHALNGERTEAEIQIDNGTNALWWNTTFEPVKNCEGKVTSVAYSATNVDERNKQVAEILSHNESLMKVAYIQSHEYRRPVASIIGLVEILKSEAPIINAETMYMLEAAVNELDTKIRQVVGHVGHLLKNT